mmetsp:Transcript_15449/g.22977  ORF Transcript_15449/g.22977 Transcript_15449/m.22977 type:complete len:790 (-) Transcript_15449:9-2378(-)
MIPKHYKIVYLVLSHLNACYSRVRFVYNKGDPKMNGIDLNCHPISTFGVHTWRGGNIFDSEESGSKELGSEESNQKERPKNWNKLKQQIRESEDVYAIFKIVAKIPPILSNFDGALEISEASLDDARLAIEALYKLAFIVENSPTSGKVEFVALQTIVNDIRFLQLIEVVKCQLNDLSTLDLANLVWSMAILDYRNGDILHKISRTLIHRVQNEMDLKDGKEMIETLSSFSKACKNLNFNASELFSECADKLLPIIDQLSLADIAKLVQSYTLVGTKSENLINKAIEAVTATSGKTKIGAKESANLVFSFAMQGVTSSSIYERLIEHLLPVINSLSEENLCNLAYGLASTIKMRHRESSKDDEKVDWLSHEFNVIFTIMTESDLRLSAFKDRPLYLSRMMWSLATWQNESPDQYHLSGCSSLIARAVLLADSNVSEYLPIELVHLIWAYAVLTNSEASSISIRSPNQRPTGLGASKQMSEVFGIFCGYIKDHIQNERLEMSLICQVVWSLAVLQFSAHDILRIANDKIGGKNLYELPLEMVTNIAWAYARLNHPDNHILYHIMRITESHLNCMELHHAANVLWALATMGYSLKIKCSFSLSLEKLKELNPSSLANLAFGLSHAKFASSNETNKMTFQMDILKPLTESISLKLLSFSPRELALCASAYVNFDFSEFESEECGDDGRNYMFMELLHAKEIFAKTLLNECSKWENAFTSSELVDLLNFIRSFNQKSEATIKLIESRVSRRKDDVNELALSEGSISANAAAFNFGVCEQLLNAYYDCQIKDEK